MKKHKAILQTRRHRWIPRIKLKQPSRQLVVILSSIVLFLFVSSAFTIFVPIKTPEVIVRIKPGDNTRTISYKLMESKVIRSAMWFDVLARLNKFDRQLKAGRYVFGGNVNLWQTIHRIRDGKSSLIHLTIPEGFSLHKTLKRMERSGIGSYDSLMALATNPSIVKSLTGYNWKTLEGLLYPETYTFDVELMPEQIFSLMIKQFYKKLSETGISITDDKDFYNKLIIASIVEKEAVLESEKPMIAGVFLNRLRKGIRLESCPTVDYVLELKGIKKKQLSYEDLEMESAFNTYKLSGLPPNPICNPSVYTLQAVLNPEVTEYMYFFADFDGRNIFSKTYKEHINKQKIYNR